MISSIYEQKYNIFATKDKAKNEILIIFLISYSFRMETN